jgi:hypothetical protein
MVSQNTAGGKVTRPPLNRVPLSSVWPPRRGRCYATMSVGQWDAFMASAYDAGFVLLEVDEREQPVKAYRRP